MENIHTDVSGERIRVVNNVLPQLIDPLGNGN